MAYVSIDHPTDRPNFTLVEVGSLQLAFSYKTVIGFNDAWSGWVLRENEWGPITGKHLNWLNTDADRVPGEEFEALLATVLDRLTPAVSR